MRTSISRAVATARALFLVVSVMSFTSTIVSAQTNSWKNPASGNWEDATNWSLGIPPDSSQSIVVTNSGFKAVAVQSSTASGYPQTLSVNSVTITSPTNSLNTLLMNYAGVGSPLVIGVDSNTPGRLLIDSSSAMTMFSSGLIVNNALGTNNSRLGEFEVDGTFSQSDGSEVVANFLDLNGTYNLTNGNLFVGNQFINGTFNEQGGTNLATSVALDGGYYDLVDGTLNTGSLTLTNAAELDQYGGYHTNNGMIMTSTTDSSGNPVTAIYTLNGGDLETPFVTMNGASFNHYAGTDSIGTLSMSLFSAYLITSGSLAVNQIQLRGNSAFYHTTGSLTGVGNVTFADGLWVEQGSGVQLGQLQLASGVNSEIALTSGSCVLQFADSSSVPWSSDGLLTIQNWSGSLNGGGSEQLYFGTSASGLTSQQLSQVQFSNPAGLPAGTYAAEILSDGEVVPKQGSSASGQTNFWINPGNGNWDDATSWSLGNLPGSSQSVMITNSGSKAVAINLSTPVNFPGSMTVSNLTIQGSTNTENTLLMNNFGTAVPLTVLNGLTLQDDAQILNLNSGLVVRSGSITVTNSQINQDGGIIGTTNSPMSLQNSIYNLTNGVLEAGSVSIGFPVSAHFNQYGGTASITNLGLQSQTAGSIPNGISLYGGTLKLPNGMQVLGGPGGLSYLQAGGTNVTTQVTIGAGYAGSTPTFTLNGGLLADVNVQLMGGDFGGPQILAQNGGSHVIANSLSIAGGNHLGEAEVPAIYNLNGGTLSAGTIELDANQGDSQFVESNGTVSAQIVYAHSVGYYLQNNTTITLAGGTLTCSNFTTDDGGGQLNQSGGSLVVSNLLKFGGSRSIGGPVGVVYGQYTLTGGTVTASNIIITSIFNIGNGTTNRITNPGTCTLSNTLIISNATEQLGRFILVSSAVLNLAGSASRLSFANSRGEGWAGNGVLLVSNWNGSPSGGGAEQLKFGTDQTGLTSAQLNQIEFSIGTNFYSAKILSTGEVVPNQAVTPLLVSSTQGNDLILSWPSGYTLQTATNVSGPYTAVSGATSPYTNNMTLDRQRFFRLAP